MEPTTIAGKPVVSIKRKTVINMKSGFAHKLLCDGPTFSMGDSCVFSCSFCYVENQAQKDVAIQQVLTPLGKPLGEVVIRRENALAIMREQLTQGGRPRFADTTDNRVIYASPLVDVAGNMDLVRETIDACHIILSLTNWHIRLLSKSSLLTKVAEALAEHRDRMIYGFSTGTLSDEMTKVFECGTALASKRVKALHQLQDAGFRTFGMICPSLPQRDYDDFAGQQAEALRVDQCEHVWAEVLNERGESLARTVKGLADGGFDFEANALAAVGIDQERWEAYARATFEAHSQNIPDGKLRFLQYVTKSTVGWWADRKSQGAVLLGQAAETSI